MTPCRLVDTRPESDDNKALVQAEGAIGQDKSRAYNGAGACGVPSNATALSVNLTSVSPTVQTVLTLWDTGAARPAASTLNPDPLVNVIANTTNVALGTSGKFDIHNEWGQVDYVIDVLGYYVDGFGTSAIPNLPDTGDGFSLIIEIDKTIDDEYLGYVSVYRSYWGTIVNLEKEGRWVSLVTTSRCPSYTFDGPMGPISKDAVEPGRLVANSEMSQLRVEARSTTSFKFSSDYCGGPVDAVMEGGGTMREAVANQTFATKEFTGD